MWDIAVLFLQRKSYKQIGRILGVESGGWLFYYKNKIRDEYPLFWWGMTH